jgi:hypothetical protein
MTVPLTGGMQDSRRSGVVSRSCNGLGHQANAFRAATQGTEVEDRVLDRQPGQGTEGPRRAQPRWVASKIQGPCLRINVLVKTSVHEGAMERSPCRKPDDSGPRRASLPPIRTPAQARPFQQISPEAL